MSEVATIERGSEVAVAPVDVTNSMAMLARAAADPNVSPEKMEALYAIASRMKADEAKVEFQRAMAAAQAEMRPVVRDAENKHTLSRYARLETIDEAIRPIYTRHGFSLSFDSPVVSGATVKVTCDVAHSAGHSRVYTLEGALDSGGMKGASNKTPIQALGSTISYLQRYLTKMIFNITLKNEDNDGNSTRKGYREPVEQAQAKRVMTPDEWLDALQDDLLAAETEEAVDGILARPDVQEAQQKATGAHRARLFTIIKEARELERVGA